MGLRKGGGGGFTFSFFFVCGDEPRAQYGGAGPLDAAGSLAARGAERRHLLAAAMANGDAPALTRGRGPHTGRCGGSYVMMMMMMMMMK